MSLLCAWCGQWIVKDRPLGLISHGICRACADKMMAQMLATEAAHQEKQVWKH